jgi:hypothetical protein
MTIRLSAVPLENIDRPVLEAQVGSLQESRTIDFKELPYGEADKDKIECAKDLSAFANVDGGRLIIGAVGENETLKEFRPIAKSDAEKACQTIINLATSRVDEPLLNVRTWLVDWDDDKVVIVVDIPPSARRPHAVRIYKDRYSFVLRTDRKSDWISIAEVRRLFREEIERNLKSTSWVDWTLREIEEEIGDTPTLLYYAVPLRLPETEVITRREDWWPKFLGAFPNTQPSLPFPDPSGNPYGLDISAFLDRWTWRQPDVRRLLVYRRGLIAAHRSGFGTWEDSRTGRKPACIWEKWIEDAASHFASTITAILPEEIRAVGMLFGFRILNSMGLVLLADSPHLETQIGEIRRSREASEIRIDGMTSPEVVTAELISRFRLAFGVER